MAPEKMVLALTRSAIRGVPACFTTDFLGTAAPPIPRSSNHFKSVAESLGVIPLKIQRGNHCPPAGLLLYISW